MSYTERLNAAWETKNEELVNALLRAMTERDKLIYAIEVDDDYNFVVELMNQDPYIDLGDTDDGPGPLATALKLGKYKMAAAMLDRSKQEWEAPIEKHILRVGILLKHGY